MPKFHVKTMTRFPLHWDELEAESLDDAREKAIAKSDNMVDASVSTVKTEIIELKEI